MVCSLDRRNALFIVFFKDFEKDLIAVLLVVESVHDKNKLLYKYELRSPDKLQCNDIVVVHRKIHRRRFVLQINQIVFIRVIRLSLPKNSNHQGRDKDLFQSNLSIHWF